MEKTVLHSINSAKYFGMLGNVGGSCPPAEKYGSRRMGSFPSPFYIFEAPIWFWHDLAITLILIGTVMLTYLAFKD